MPFSLLAPPIYTIGQAALGGIVAYINGGGTSGTSGFIVSSVDIASTLTWGCRGTSIPGATGTAIGTGKANTAAILAGCPTRPIAASACATYTGGGYSDWYLPSYDELNVLYNNRVALSIGNNFYWTSSQADANSAYYQYFGNGARSNTFKDNDFGGGQIRAIRDFVSKN